MNSSFQLSINSEVSQKLANNPALRDSVSALGQEINQLFSDKLNQLLQQYAAPTATASNPAGEARAPAVSSLALAGGSSASSTSSLTSATSPTAPSRSQLPNHEFRSGNVGLKMHRDGERISEVFYYGNDGQRLGSSAFYAADILRAKEKFNVNLEDFRGIGQQLDAAGIGYRPNEQYALQGSNHGINFEDLINGGMGTAYDWTADANVHLKGPFAADQLKADQELAARLGLRFTGGVPAAPGSSAAAVAATAGPVTVSSQSLAQPQATSPTTTTSAATPVTSLSKAELAEVIEAAMNQIFAGSRMKIEQSIQQALSKIG